MAELEGRSVQGLIAAANAAQGPADSFLHEVTIINRRSLYQMHCFHELLVRRFPVMQGQRGQDGEGSAPYELLLPWGPGLHLSPTVGRAVKEMKAERVADCPVIEIPRPAVHLTRGDEVRFLDKRDEHPRFMPLGVPEGEGQLVIAPEALR